MFCADCALRDQRIASKDCRESVKAHYQQLNVNCYCRFVPNEIVFLSHKQYMALGAEPVPPSLLAHLPGLERVHA
jgi:hypothetical protein